MAGGGQKITEKSEDSWAAAKMTEKKHQIKDYVNDDEKCLIYKCNFKFRLNTNI